MLSIRQLSIISLGLTLAFYLLYVIEFVDLFKNINF